MRGTRAPAGHGAALAGELLGERALADEPLGARTTYRVGGRAALLVVVEDGDALAATAAAAVASGVEVLVLGNGSNLLVRDGGFDGLAVHLGGEFGEITVDEAAAEVTGGGAAAYPALARQSAAAGLGAMEWAVGIPGTVGGAVRMNAGGHGSATVDRLVTARLFDLATGEERTAGPGELALSYRSSNVASSEVVLAARFSCERSDPAEAAGRVADIVRWRREHQPGGRNAGSVFANPPGDSAGRLVEAAGLKGRRIGSAEVSTKHANFIQVDPGGSADDVERLIELVRRVVEERTGVALATELRIVGRPS